MCHELYDNVVYDLTVLEIVYDIKYMTNNNLYEMLYI